MNVKLLCDRADPELLCGTAALTSTRSGSPSEILERVDADIAKQIIGLVTAYL